MLFWLCKQKGIKMPDLLWLARADVRSWHIRLFYYTLFFTKPKQHVLEIIYGRRKFVGDFNMGRGKFVGDRFWYGYTIKECGLKIYRICPIRIEIIYGKGKLVGDFNMGNIICTNITPRYFCFCHVIASFIMLKIMQWLWTAHFRWTNQVCGIMI